MKKFILMICLFLGLVNPLSAISRDCHIEGICWDYIIIGNGTAGAVLARKLTDCNFRVLVLEAGVNQDTDPVVLTASGSTLFADLNQLTFNPKYAVTYTINAFNPLEYTIYSEGRGWGGSSKHNYLEVIRGTPSIYDQWAVLSGNPNFSYNNSLPLMLALENYTPCQSTINTAQRGVGGPISVTQQVPVTSDPLAQILAAGTGAGFISDINDPTDVSTTGHLNLGFSAYQLFATANGACNIGQRSFSSNSFLPPSIVTPNGKGLCGRTLRIESNAFVSKILFSGCRATGVEFIYGCNADRILTARARNVILCAGSVNSPAILQRSGIGNPAILGPLGIKTLVANPNVGANLANQYGPTMIALGTTNAQPFLQGFINASGVTTPAGFAYPNDNTRRIQFAALQLAPGVVEIISFILDPNSRGNIQIVSTNPLVQPLINLNMYSDGSVTTSGTDANLAVATYYLLQQSLGAANVIFPSTAQFDTPETLLQAAQSLSGLTIADHITATCRMSTSIESGVVDSNFNVFGTENLKVVDASVIPLLPDGNICYGVYVMALQAAKSLGLRVPPAL